MRPPPNGRALAISIGFSLREPRLPLHVCPRGLALDDVPGIPTDSQLFALPANLPCPTDDGAARHLPGALIPHVRLRLTSGRTVDIAKASRSLTVFFLYPATIASPAVIPGEWSAIPGARGCTIQNVGFREAYPEFARLGCQVFGVSGQGQTDPDVGLAEQAELVRRIDLPFKLLNDSHLELVSVLKLPTFVASLKQPTVEFEGKLATFPHRDGHSSNV